MFDAKVKTLLSVIETGSYTKAAEKLNLTQPAVSHQIRMLENEFDIKIFYRDKNKLIELFSNDIITLEELKTRTSALNSEIAEWQHRKESSTAVFDLDKLHTQIASLFGDIRSVLLNSSFDNKLLKQLIEEIIVDEKGQIEIKFRALKELPPFSLSLYEPTE